MSPIRIAIAAALLAVVPATGPAGTADEMSLEILRNTIQANKRALVAVNLTLSDEEAAAFWPIYDEYQARLTKVHARLLALIEDYTASFADLPNAKALRLMDEYLTVEADRVAVRRDYIDDFAKVLPGRTVARFYQIENKMDAVLRYDLAAEIPVVDE